MAVFLMIIAMFIFSVPHSILARLPIKSWFSKRMGERAYEGFYRIGYSVVSVITFLPVMAVLVLSPGQSIWNLSGAVAIVFRLMQLAGLIGMSISLLQIELGRFAGLVQLRAYVNGDPLPLPDEPLKTDGVYALVRHPLYFFSLLLLWFTPQMISTSLIFVITVTIYFLVGSLFEERTMVKLFGETYIQYQKQVPWMIPFLKSI